MCKNCRTPNESESAVFCEQCALNRVIDGDEDAMLVLYGRYSELVYRQALHVLRDTGAAEDVTQEVFLHLWQAARSFNSRKGTLSGWLAVIARHRAIDALRKKTREPALYIEHLSHNNVLEQALLSESINVLAVLLPLLSAQQRDVLRLTYVSGLSHSEISLKMGAPLGTVKSRIRGALLMLRKKWSDREMSPAIPIETCKKRTRNKNPPLAIRP